MTILLALAAMLAACRSRDDAASGATGAAPGAIELRVSAAVSLTEVLTAIDADFTRETGTRVQLNLAGSQTLAAQILEGADVDVFVSADSAQMDRVAQGGRVVDGSRIDLLSNALVVLCPTDRCGSLTQPRDLLAPGVRRIAIGDPAAVPAGVYARQALERAGIWADLQPKLVQFPHVRAVVTAVASGAADAGFVYRTDARVARDARIAWEVPAAQTQPIRYAAAILQGTRHADAARAYLRHLQSAGAARLFTEAGFNPLTASPAAAPAR